VFLIRVEGNASTVGKLEAAEGVLLAVFVALDDPKIMSIGMRERADRS
jgi:hypothetical protein